MPQKKHTLFLSFFICFVLVSPYLKGQEEVCDSIRVPNGYMLVLLDTVIMPAFDTVIVLQKNRYYKLKENPYKKSQAFYDTLRLKSSEEKWSNELYGALIRSSNYSEKLNGQNIRANTEYLPYEGLRINKIYFHNVDMLVGNVRDTSIKADAGLMYAINKSHISTLEKVLKKNLVIKEGETINANRMADNERVLRSLSFIEDASLMVVVLDSTQADVIVVTQDLFPIGLGGSYSSINKFEVQISHSNFMGTGQGVKYRSVFNTAYKPVVGNQIEYKLNNVGKSFATLYVKYRKTPVYENWQGKLNRNFITPEIKYGYGIEADYIDDAIYLHYPDTSVLFDYSSNSQSFWLGRSFLFSPQSRKNLILALKYTRTHYMSRPEVTTDSNQYFANSDFILGNAILLRRNTVKTRYIRGFGRVEDVPVGYLVSGTFGYERSDLYDLFYAGMRYGYGYALKKGAYIGYSIEAGSYYSDMSVRGVVNIALRCYTPLLKVNRSKLRIGCEMIYKDGIRRDNYEWIDLASEIKGISGTDSRGKSKTAAEFESVLFTDRYFYGFRFAPYAFGSAGLIRYNNPAFYKGTLFSSIGLGLRLRNESLVFPTFEFRFSYYTHNPTDSQLYKFTFSDREPRTFNELHAGEPEIVKY